MRELSEEELVREAVTGEVIDSDYSWEDVKTKEWVCSYTGKTEAEEAEEIADYIMEVQLEELRLQEAEEGGE